MAGSLRRLGRLGQGPRHDRHRLRRRRRWSEALDRAADRRVGVSSRASRARGSCTHAGHEGRPARSSSPTSSATCCSTSPAPRRTTWRCARRPCAAACTCPSTGSSTTRRARRRAARPRRRCTARSGCDWIPPELREGRGELEAATPAGAACRSSIELEDLRGDLHCHTTLSDGTATLEEMARRRVRARLRVPRDHRPLGHARVRRPRHARRAARPIERVRALERALDGFELLIGTEMQHPPGRLARLRGRRCSSSSTG